MVGLPEGLAVAPERAGCPAQANQASISAGAYCDHVAPKGIDAVNADERHTLPGPACSGQRRASGSDLGYVFR